jgi:hypothetical protein
MFLLTVPLKAQHYTRDVGARAGAYPAICYRQYTDDNGYSEVMASLTRNAIRVTYLKEYARPALQRFSPDLAFVYGFGAHSGFNRINQYNILNRTYFYDRYRYSPLLGIIVGIDVKPFFEYSVNQFFTINLFDTSLILKIKF